MPQSFVYLITLILFSIIQLQAQQLPVIKIWKNKVPDALETKAPHQTRPRKGSTIGIVTKVTDPDITVYTPKKPNGKNSAILILPGGGYNFLAHEHEGTMVADYLNQRGYHAFLLRYRVPTQKKGAFQDAQRALRIIKANSVQYGINPEKVGIIGFSAGGNLAARISTNFQRSSYPAQDKIDLNSARPAFTILLYPAYMDQGPNNSLSPDLVITKQTPPAFLFTAVDDFAFVNGSLVFASQLQKYKIPYSLRIYPSGGHGFGLKNKSKAAKQWPIDLMAWLEETLNAL